MLYVAPADDPFAVEAFILDQPASLEWGIGHVVLTLIWDVTIEIAERLEVTSDRCRFDR